MGESERVRGEVFAAAEQITEATAGLARLSRRKEFEAELRARGNWLADGVSPAPDWVRPWHDYFERLPDDPEYRRLAAEARRAADALDVETMVERLGSGDAEAVEWAIAYVEADPWYFRSGYTKARLSRGLRQVGLREKQRERLRVAILNNLGKGSRFEFGETRRLARRLDSAKFRESIERFLKHPDKGTVERARRLLESCRLNETRGDLRGAR